MSYDFAIAFPPGMYGTTPQLSISYGSQFSGKAGWLGAGWDIPLSHIQRDIEFTRRDASDDTFDLILEGSKSDLVWIASENKYRTRIESYLKIEKRTGAPNATGEYWVVTQKDGTEYRFGYNPDSEHIVNARDPWFDGAPGRRFVWRWSLDQVKEANGNCIYYTWAGNPTANDRGAVYLSKIEYNNDRTRSVEFVLEDSDRPDAYLTMDQGSEVLEARRLKEILVKVEGALVSKYAFTYAMNEIGTRSLLTAITRFGADGVSALPPVKFAYKPLRKSFGTKIDWYTPGERMIRRSDSDNDSIVDTLDMNGDGKPDLVSYDKDKRDHWDVWLNTGRGFAAANQKWTVPNEWEIRDTETFDGKKAPNTRCSPMDLNRDGYVDLAWAADNRSLDIKLGNGSYFAGASTRWGLPDDMWIREVRPPKGDDTANVMQDFMDMTGDGLPDIVKMDSSARSWEIWRNTGSGFVFLDRWRVYHGTPWVEEYKLSSNGATQTKVARYDVNGDGLPDIVDAASTNWKIYLNTGSGFVSAGSWSAEDMTDVNDTEPDGDTTRDFIDINGDGLPDIVNPRDRQDYWEVKFNTGKGFTRRMRWDPPPAIADKNLVRNVDDDGNVVRDLFDMDGDGAPDVVRKMDSNWQIYPNAGAQADLLDTITDSLGGTTKVTYASSAEYANTRLPFGMWVVKEVTTGNGMTGPHALAATTRYSYEGGLYDFKTREFRSFAKVSETRPDGSVAIHHFHQDEALKGKEKLTEVTDAAGALFSATEQLWASTDAGGYLVTRLDASVERTHDGSVENPKVARREYRDYDAYGNPGLEVDFGDVAVSGDETWTWREYAYNPDLWIVDRPKHQRVAGSPGGATLREQWFAYDGVEVGDAPTRGNLTREESLLAGGANPETLHEYDLYGNRTKTTDPLGRVTTVEYDPVFHTFPARTVNPLGQAVVRTFNPANGEPTSETDPNGYVTSVVHDTFQRKVKEVRPYDSEALPTTEYLYDLDGVPPERVVVVKREVSGGEGKLETVSFVDGLGNLVRTRMEYQDAANRIGVDYYYDTMGRLQRQSNPYLTDAADAYGVPDPAVPAIVYVYDALGRPTIVTNPDGTTRTRAFEHWRVDEVDETGSALRRKSYRFRGDKRLLEVTERNAGAEYVTSYSYSALGELTGVRDHHGNVTTIEYDTLGRKTRMVDPDLGTWGYRYDAAGNLVSQTDARGITTAIVYDALNRKTLVDYPKDKDVAFTYDTPTIGTLSRVVDAAGSSAFTFDQRLRKLSEERRMDALRWTTEWAYDAMDRVVAMTYPDGEVVSYLYTPQGTLGAIPGIVSSLKYNAAGRVTEKAYANGVTTTYEYHPQNLRLTKMAAPGLQNLAYTYDAVGNILTIADGVAGRTETFGYDDLDRLTSAGDSGYARTYAYDAIGDMTAMTKEGRPYGYTYGTATAQPHAVKGVSSPVPTVGLFLVNNGAPRSTANQVTLHNVAAGSPTQYLASEDRAFAGAAWQAYSAAPSFLLSGGIGRKTIYFKVRNADGESDVKSDQIEFAPDFVETDSDGDGLSDYLEGLYGTDPAKKDTDGDGIGDYDEIFVGRTDPTDPDSDGDGVGDKEDREPNDPHQDSASASYALSISFDAGNGSRGSAAYSVSDRIGAAVGGRISNVSLVPRLEVDPAIQMFGEVELGEAMTLTATLANAGVAALTIQGVAPVGAGAASFAVPPAHDLCTGRSLAQGASCTVRVRFAPTVAGVKEAQLQVLSNDAAAGTTPIDLVGLAVDTVPPQASIKINNGAPYTSVTAATLNLACTDASGCTQMRFSDDGDVWTAPQAFAATRVWTLPAGDGFKSVYAQFRDGAGNWTALLSDSIAYDTTPPEGSVAIAGGAPFTNTAAVTLSLPCSDVSGCSQMQMSHDGAAWQPAVAYASTAAWTLAAGDGEKRVHARFRNGVNLWSGGYSDAVVLDTQAPATTATPPGGTYTTIQSIALSCGDGSGSGCNETFWCLGADCDPSTPYREPIVMGFSNVLRFASTDNAGNREVTGEQVYEMLIPHLEAGVVLLGESFRKGFPAGWSVRGNWSTANPCERAIPAPFAAPWAIADYGCGATAKATLTSAPFSAFWFDALSLLYDNQFDGSTKAAKAAVSADGGIRWRAAGASSGDDGFPVPNAKAAVLATGSGVVNAQVRFTTAQGSDTDFWAIDNVTLVGTPARLVFEAQVGLAAEKKLLVRNRGAADLSIAGVSLAGAGKLFRLAGDACTGKVLAPGASCVVRVGFKSATAGSRGCTLTIDSNDPEAARESIPVYATAFKGVTLLGPAAGETVKSGAAYPVRWTGPAAAVTYDLHYSLTGGSTWTPLANGVKGTEYVWRLPRLTRTNKSVVVRVTGFDAGKHVIGTASTDGKFTILKVGR